MAGVLRGRPASAPAIPVERRSQRQCPDTASCGNSAQVCGRRVRGRGYDLGRVVALGFLPEDLADMIERWGVSGQSGTASGRHIEHLLRVPGQEYDGSRFIAMNIDGKSWRKSFRVTACR